MQSAVDRGSSDSEASAAANIDGMELPVGGKIGRLLYFFATLKSHISELTRIDVVYRLSLSCRCLRRGLVWYLDSSARLTTYMVSCVDRLITTVVSRC